MGQKFPQCLGIRDTSLLRTRGFSIFTPRGNFPHIGIGRGGGTSCNQGGGGPATAAKERGRKQAADTGGAEDSERNVDVQRKRIDCER